jgi:serine/threonine protein kinase
MQPNSGIARDPSPSDSREGDTYSGGGAPADDPGVGSAVVSAQQTQLDHLEDAAAPIWPLDARADQLATLDGASRVSMLEAGSLISGRYRLSRFVSRGGMGEVYEAFDGFLGERVALKMILPAAYTPNAARELQSEVRLARRVTHPNVCRIHDLGLHADVSRRYWPIPFLTMEFIEGQTLGERLRAGRLPIWEAQSIARQLLLGLGAAHTAGVLHGDFKSDNVMLRQLENGDVEPVITDFGLARAFETSAYLASGGALAGSIDYMAPEQLLSGRLGRETDLFAFGVVFFQMITGRLPFSTGGSPIASAIRRLQERPELPSQVVAGLNPSIDEFILTCLRRERSDRFPDAEAALRALDACDTVENPRLGMRLRRAAVSIVSLYSPPDWQRWPISRWARRIL